jgi:flavin reductase (DIM6/NTAB) family NADH-FMN oxidoreductase RutF
MSISSNDLRNATGLFPTGVAIVTTAPGELAPFGMTVNSFTSLSLDPPLVMWNLQKSSDTFRAWHDADTFAVNILRLEQEDLSNRHASKGKHELEEGDYKSGTTGCPVLKESLTFMECKVHARYEEGDHVIMIGEVVNIESYPEAEPLVFHKGKYRKVV